MSKRSLIDEIHITVSTPKGLREDRYQRMRRALNSRRLQVLLKEAIRGCFRQFRALRGTRFRLTR